MQCVLTRSLQTSLVMLLALGASLPLAVLETTLSDNASAEARGRRTPVEIVADVDGADVFIDGEHKGTTPLARPLRLRHGERVIRVVKRGHSDYFNTIKVPRRKRKVVVEVTLIPITGILRIESQPSGAQVTLGENYLGDTPFDGDIEEGMQVLRIQAKGFAPHQTELNVDAGQTYEFDVTLTPVEEPGFYTEWWFWTGAVAIASGITLAIVLSGDEPAAQPSRPRIQLPLHSW